MEFRSNNRKHIACAWSDKMRIALIINYLTDYFGKSDINIMTKYDDPESLTSDICGRLKKERY